MKAGIAGFSDFNFTQHLTNDDLDVLVVDLHALQTVNVLDLVDDVLGQRLTPFRRRMSCGSLGPSEITSPFHLFAFEHGQVTPLRNQLFVVGTSAVAVVRGNNQTTLAFGFLTEAMVPLISARIAGFFRTTRFEQVGNTRQTTGDVTGLRSLLAGYER